jgi:hypothetical protein
MFGRKEATHAVTSSLLRWPNITSREVLTSFSLVQSAVMKAKLHDSSANIAVRKPSFSSRRLVSMYYSLSLDSATLRMYVNLKKGKKAQSLHEAWALQVAALNRQRLSGRRCANAALGVRKPVVEHIYTSQGTFRLALQTS